LDDKPRGAQLLIISPTEPTRPDWLTDQDEWETKVIPPTFFQTRRYRFQLHANPTVKRVVRDAAGNRKKNGKRESIKGEAALRAWLQRKGESGGFFVPETVPLEIFSDVSHFSKKSKTAQPMNGTHGTVDISGILEVTDSQLFLQQTFTKGIGSAKAFGFGLLVLAPI
jgi:CRISPR system Cascade subunit CasE